MRYLLTGGAGFLGSHTAERLVSLGHSVTILDNFSSGKRENLTELGKNIEILEGDILDPVLCQKAADGVDHVVHLAAQVSVARSVDNPAETHRINIDGTVNVLEAARRANAKSLVFLSSCAVYGDTRELPITEAAPVRPISPYAVSKLSGEYYCHSYFEQFGLKTCVVRLFNIFGPKQDPCSPYSGVMSIFLQRLSQKAGVTIYGDGHQTRDFVYVGDVARILATLGAEIDRFPERCYNVATGTSTSINDLWRQLSELAPDTLTPVHDSSRHGEIKHSLGSAARLTARLASTNPGFRFTPLAEGLKPTFDWYQKTR
ncbi:MAG: NAD-dependent epimerase/dehydratase family protein [Deltaproteobacteria bacterium]|nr:NAD-dependent epimerase/dehydratase family protein [Deltaproteobacteria bacterium]MBI3295069.1 NAD-dependent epimerase/dehydratase family protein [Deltaproteobacteria bacterium]